MELVAFHEMIRRWQSTALFPSVLCNVVVLEPTVLKEVVLFGCNKCKILSASLLW